MSDRNCWKCRHNTAINTCEVIDDYLEENEERADATADWINANMVRDTQMPPRKTETPCPGFSEVPNV